MKILIDFTQIPVKKVGVGVYALNTFSEMIEKHKHIDFYTVTQDDDDELDFRMSNVKNIRVNSKIFRNLLLRSILEQVYIPYLSRKYKIDIIHSLHYSFPLVKTKAKKIITIHDLTFFIYPKLHQVIKRYYFRWFINKASRNKQNTTICVSKSTLDDLNTYVPNNQSKNYVVPLACNDTCQNTTIDVRKKFNITRPYITFIGTLEPRKNIEGLIRAFSLMKNREKYNLVIVGKKGWYYTEIFNLIQEKNLSHDVIFTGFVSIEEKYSLLKQSELFVYPSFYEGFGLPVLEAVSLGIPTITSNISSLPEVGGSAAIYIDPHNVKEMAETMNRVLNDLSLRTQMVKEGYEQAKKFSWVLTADKTFKIYQDTIKD